MSGARRGLRSIGWADRGRALVVGLALVAVQVSVWTLGYQRSRRMVDIVARLPPRRRGAPAVPRRTLLVNGVAAALPLPANCLARSLVLWGWLRRHDESAELWFGARIAAGGALEAHAWVSAGDVVLNDTADVAERYPPFPQPVRRT